jgi:nucleotide-binding universal stress UspA family protein
MVVRPSVLCAVDFSDASRGALRYAATLAEHFYAALTVLTVDDPFLVDSANLAVGEGWLEKETAQELETFVHHAFPGRTPQVAEVRLQRTTGKPATEILRVATESHADVIVMSTHGLSGVRKMVFGSTTARVLRNTHLPVIVTPASDPGPESLEDWRRTIKSVVVPVDLSEHTARQLHVARGLVEALRTSLVLVHVLEPLHILHRNERLKAHAEATRRARASHELESLVATIPPPLAPRTLLAAGDPATEIARIAKEHEAGAIVMALHAAPGRQMGTVTYRLLCQTPVLVIAWPPAETENRLLHGEKLSTLGFQLAAKG